MLTVVSGPPCVGKSTYLREHAQPGDILIDYDVLAQALGSPVSHGHDEAVTVVARAARNAAIASAIRLHLAGRRVWIIDYDPSVGRREQYHRAQARFVSLVADRAELHRRADQSGRPDSWHGLIEDWYAGRA